MFNYEAEMTGAVKRWMASNDLLVKAEVISPWGICDLVGVSFEKQNVARRLELGQKKAVTSMTRAALLLQIPDVETNESISISELVKRCAPVFSEETVIEEAASLIGSRFIVKQGDRLQKVNGWMPLQKRLIAVELKLDRIEEALQQAENNLGFATESYVGLPRQMASRVLESSRRAKFMKRGVGLLGVGRNSCEMLIQSHPAPTHNPVFQFCCVERFWRTFAKGN